MIFYAVEPCIIRRLETLETRRRFLKFAALGCLLLGVGAALLGVFALPEKVFVPDALLKIFPQVGYEETYAAKGMYLITLVITWSAPLFLLLGAAWLAARARKKAAEPWRSSFASLLRLLTCLCLVILLLHKGLPMFLRWSGNIDISQSTFLHSINRSDFAEAHRWMLDHRVLGQDGSQFVLAQLALQENLQFSKDFWLNAARDAIEAEKNLGRDVTADYGGLVELAAVERAAYGEVQTPAAQNFAGESVGEKISGFMVISGILTGFAVFFALLSTYCSGRLNRIRNLLGIANEKFQSPADCRADCDDRDVIETGLPCDIDF